MAATVFAHALMGPSSSFSRPADVVEHPVLCDDQKRIILLARANGARGLECVDARDLADFKAVSRLGALFDSLDQLDPNAAAN